MVGASTGMEEGCDALLALRASVTWLTVEPGVQYDAPYSSHQHPRPKLYRVWYVPLGLGSLQYLCCLLLTAYTNLHSKIEQGSEEAAPQTYR